MHVCMFAHLSIKTLCDVVAATVVVIVRVVVAVFVAAIIAAVSVVVLAAVVVGFVVFVFNIFTALSVKRISAIYCPCVCVFAR